jgi:uncharacterized LabA/DUF88 family protein
MIDMQRVVSYIDGFNLYYGLKAQNWQRYFWLDVQALSKHLLKPHQTLVQTKYFTARISQPPDKVKRQSTYIDAIQTLPDVGIYFGHYLAAARTCYNCGSEHTVFQEKMTDVNIAVELLQDAFQDLYDTALLISADSDLIAPVAAIRKLFPAKRVVVACPPKRFSHDLCKSAHAYFQIDRIPIARSQFPEEVPTKSGFILKRPESWK